MEGPTKILGLFWLHKVWDAFAEALHELTSAIGVPICVDGCGLCCTVNTPTALGIEVQRAAVWLREQDQSTQDTILDRIETWLVRPVLEVAPLRSQVLPIINATMGSATPPNDFGLEINACLSGRCPLLDAELRCSVHEVRPMSCRAYGVTKLADTFCKRPAGRNESSMTRAIFEGEGVQNLATMIEAMKDAISTDSQLSRWGVFPTELYAIFRPARIRELLPMIPLARRVGGVMKGSPAQVFQNLDVSPRTEQALKIILNNPDTERLKVTLPT